MSSPLTAEVSSNVEETNHNTKESVQTEKADKHETNDEPIKKQKVAESDSELGSIVAAHYNSIAEKGLNERYNSPIFYVRNFNNWVKSVMIQEFVDKAREKDYGRPLRVLDICCGKGGDLGKWQKARVDHVVFADIAGVSVQQCQDRYGDLKRRTDRLFSAQFITADCTKEKLRDKYEDPSINFDLVSCQFGLHYSFESLSQARRMLTNISECLKPNGYFFGTMPDANEIVSRCKKSQNNEFGNRILNIKLLFNSTAEYPLFGGKYDFHLEGVVNCPEFLVHFETFEKLAFEYGLELVYKARFTDFYKQHSGKYRDLLSRINCFESYPPSHGKQLLGAESEYDHAKDYLDKNKRQNENICLGTMSTSEWEVATIYVAFAFKKCKSTIDANGKVTYISTKTSTSTKEQ